MIKLEPAASEAVSFDSEVADQLVKLSPTLPKSIRSVPTPVSSLLRRLKSPFIPAPYLA